MVFDLHENTYTEYDYLCTQLRQPSTFRIVNKEKFQSYIQARTAGVEMWPWTDPHLQRQRKL